MNTKLSPYPETPVAKITQKSNKRNTWNEVVILYGKFEFLITGGLFGTVNDSTFKSFLGASLNLKLSTEEDHAASMVYVLKSPQANTTFTEERLLQNYSRRSAAKKWGIRSIRFALKGFSTVNPLYTNYTSLERAASLVLKCLAYNEFTMSDKVELMDYIHAAALNYEININRGNDTDYLNALQLLCNEKFKIVIISTTLLISTLNNFHHPQSVINGKLATSIFKDVVNYRCNLLQKQMNTNETYLL